jgi:hypothetical protein
MTKNDGCNTRRLWANPFKVSLVILWGLSMASYASGQTGTPSTQGTISVVQMGRPLAAALDRVQQLLLSPITYEEVPYESPDDLSTFTVETGAGPRTIHARPILDFTFTLGSTDTNPYWAAQSVLRAYQAAGLAGAYKVVQENNRVDVIPVQVRAVNGSMRDLTPVMSQTVTFPTAKRKVEDTVQLVVDAVSRGSGSRVLLLEVPFFHWDTVELGAAGESARDVITNIGAKYNLPLSFRCLYDATDKTYYLNVQAIAPETVPGGPPPVGKIRKPVLGPANSPWFTR